MSDVLERPPSVRRYIFFNEHRPSRAWMPTLEIINDRFCQYLRSAFLHLLPSPLEVTPPMAIQLIKHGEMTERFEVPSYLTVAELSPLRGTILVVIDAQLVNWIVESRFGGNGRFPVSTANREFTPFEQKCMRRVVDTTLEQFTRAWKPIAVFSPHILRHEINAQFAGIATAGELIILSTFDVKVGPGGGRLTICIPYAMLEPLHDHLVTGTVKRAVDHDLRWREALTIGVGQTALTLNVELAKIEITVADLLELRPGMVFEIERPERVTVEASGLPLFRARWGRVGRRIGVRIEERLLPCTPAVIPGTS